MKERRQAIRTFIENGKTVVKEVTVIVDAEEEKVKKAVVEEATSDIKIVDLTEPEPKPVVQVGTNANTQATIWLPVIKRIKLEGTKTIDLTDYAFKKREVKETMMEKLLTKMKALEETGVIYETIEIYVKDGVSYYYLPKEVTNQLGFFYGCGTTIIIDGEKFKATKTTPVYRYQWTKCQGLTSHAKKWLLPKTTFTFDEIQEYGAYVQEQVKSSRNKAWSHAEHLFRMVQSREFDKATVFQPNTKVYKEGTANRYLKKQLIALIPASKIVDKHANVTKLFDDKGKTVIKVDYDVEDMFQQLVLTETERAELDIKRTAYGIDDDNIHYMEVNVETEHGYAQSIPQVYLGKSTHSIKSSYAGGDASVQAESNKTKNVSIYSQPEHFEAKAYINYNVLKQYEKYGLLDPDYELCSVCGLPTRKDKAICNNCNTDRGDMDIRIRVLELYAEASHLSRKKGFKLPEDIFETLERLAIEDSEYKDVELVYYAYTDDVPRIANTGNRRIPKVEVK